MGAEYCIEHVCLSVSTQAYLRNHTLTVLLHQLSVHVACDCGSVLRGSVCYVRSAQYALLPVLWITSCSSITGPTFTPA